MMDDCQLKIFMVWMQYMTIMLNDNNTTLNYTKVQIKSLPRTCRLSLITNFYVN